MIHALVIDSAIIRWIQTHVEEVIIFEEVSGNFLKAEEIWIQDEYHIGKKGWQVTSFWQKYVEESESFLLKIIGRREISHPRYLYMYADAQREVILGDNDKEDQLIHPLQDSPKMKLRSLLKSHGTTFHRLLLDLKTDAKFLEKDIHKGKSPQTSAYFGSVHEMIIQLDNKWDELGPIFKLLPQNSQLIAYEGLREKLGLLMESASYTEPQQPMVYERVKDYLTQVIKPFCSFYGIK
ncbi:MAG: hypothetical protein AAFP89_26125 [Bacteroidota bacterium]